VNTGDSINFVSGATGTLKAGTINVTNDGTEIDVGEGSGLVDDPGTYGTTEAGNWAGGTTLVVYQTGWFTVLTGTYRQFGSVATRGVFTLMDDTTLFVRDNYLQVSGATLLHGGSTLLVGDEFEGMTVEGGMLATVANSSGSADATIDGDLIVEGGDVYIGANLSPHHYGTLSVTGSVDWSAGTFHPFVDNDENWGVSDRWYAGGTFTIRGTAALAPAALDGNDTPVMPTSRRHWEMITSGSRITIGNGAPSYNTDIWAVDLDPNNPPQILDLRAI
jgi:hypothetical protein